MPPTLLSKLDECPPFVCYYAAHRGRKRRPTIAELVAQAGMSSRTFSRIAHQTSWRRVRVEHMSLFIEACGIDVLNPVPILEWMAKRQASGKLTEDFNSFRGQGSKMLSLFNALASKAMMEKRAETVKLSE